MPGRIRDLLVGVEVRPAGRRRKCGRNRNHKIVKDEACLVVKREGRGEKAYCTSCADDMLNHVDTRTALIREELGLEATPNGEVV